MKASSPSLSAQPAAQQASRVRPPAIKGQVPLPCPHSSNPEHASSEITAGSPAAAAMHNHADQCTHVSNRTEPQAAYSSHPNGAHSWQAQAQRSSNLVLPSGQEGQARTAPQMLDCIGARDAMHADLWTQEGGVVEYPPAYRQLVSLQPLKVISLFAQLSLPGSHALCRFGHSFASCTSSCCCAAVLMLSQ